MSIKIIGILVVIAVIASDLALREVLWEKGMLTGPRSIFQIALGFVAFNFVLWVWLQEALQ